LRLFDGVSIAEFGAAESGRILDTVEPGEGAAGGEPESILAFMPELCD